MLKIPGRVITSCVWEGSSLRIAFAVDSFIYFAIIRPDYKWGYFSSTLVCSYQKQTGTQITFWDTNNNEASGIFYLYFSGIIVLMIYSLLISFVDAH